MLSASNKRLLQWVLTRRASDPEGCEMEYLADLANGDPNAGAALEQLRADRAAGVCTLESYRARYPHVFEPELQAA